MLDPVARQLGRGFVGEDEGRGGDVAEVAFNGCYALRVREEGCV